MGKIIRKIIIIGTITMFVLGNFPISVYAVDEGQNQEDVIAETLESSSFLKN